MWTCLFLFLLLLLLPLESSFDDGPRYYALFCTLLLAGAVNVTFSWAFKFVGYKDNIVAPLSTVACYSQCGLESQPA
ncbi:hypothetical protein BJ878DRAFT_497041 [Calycina marina]|uniref:Uncharacterized protein n=1 Tax=Calycina marina TaxID=1763456 RepID=A0A9P7Z7K6_9HELO|nr:hypothetical protein BJ878DRAFT_497041 [Calycina marina]